jgi:hypothetical protein
MTDIAQDAQRMSLLFQYGISAADEVIKWADSMIVQMDSPPDSLLELSTTAPSKTADVLSCLRGLSAGAEFWMALRSAIPQIREFVTSHPDRAEGIANHLFHTVCRFPFSDLPHDLHFIYRFDDAFSLAREGTYGEPETVYREFIHEMEKFTQAV